MRDPRDELDDLESRQLRRHLRTFTADGSDGVTVEIDGRSLVNFSSNDYLGLAGRRDLRAESSPLPGAGASRLVCGTHPEHTALECRLTEFKQTEAALTFSSGYATAVGTLQALLRKGDVVILDKLSHASLIDGARLSGATLRVFPHNDVEKLDRHLSWAKQRVADDGRILVVTESIFSMDGDRAPMTDIADCKDRHGALLLVDEAHAFGIVGPGGRGLAAELGIAERIDLHLGTFSKAAGLSGGFLAGPHDFIDLCVQRARSFIYSTAPSPAHAAAARHRIDLISSDAGDRWRHRLWKNLALLASELDLDPPASAIVPILLGSNERALAAAEQLYDAGFLIPAIRYPTVPRGKARLRLTVSAAHQPEQVRSVAAAIRSLADP